MEIRAYSEDYLSYAQRIMGDMLDFAVNTYEIDIDRFFGMFLASDVSRQFQNGNPTYVAGKTGCELAKIVLHDTGKEWEDITDAMYLDKSSEYWCGWALAFYQWYTSRSFQKIYNAIKPSVILQMYPVYHEMDILHFVEEMNARWDKYYADTNLKRFRKTAGYSQRELSEVSHVSLRQIQLFEQRERDINHCRALDLFRLSKALYCKVEDLLEI